MKLIKPSVEIISATLSPLSLIELAGRTCYKSEAKITDTSNVDFAQMILKRGHETVIEHASVTVRFICDRGVSHEIVRHRLASFSQESTRYCDYEGGHITFIIPQWVNISEGVYNIQNAPVGAICESRWIDSMARAELDYKRLRELGWRPEQARSVLPNSLKTEIVMTANLREWRHFLKLRTAKAAHPQMREVAIPLLGMMMARIPVIFDDMVVID